MTAETTQPKPTVGFKGPREGKWRLLGLSNDTDENKKAKSNQDELHNVMLSSLQMQNLVVLAGSGCSLSAGGPSMSSLWNAVVREPASNKSKAVAKKVSHDISVKNIEALLSKVEASLQVKSDRGLIAYLNVSKKIILEQCSSFLSQENLEAHIRFLHRMSRRRARDKRLKIFTTNYDLCFEQAAGLLGGVVIDGFSFTAPRRYDPRYFSYDVVRRPQGSDDASYLEGVFLLHKLHGSVNWAREASGSIIEKQTPEPDEACLIYPAAGKYQQSYTQPHLESMAQYLAALREPNTCILVAGFGFNDDHLSEPLLAAAKSNPHLRLIIVDPYAEIQSANGNKFWKAFDELSRQGEDIWFIAADFAEFSEMVPDLRSLTPAETLMRAIQGVAKSP